MTPDLLKDQPAGGPFDSVARNDAPNRAAMRAQASRARSQAKREAKATAELTRRMDEGISILRGLVAAKTGIPSEHLGVILEPGKLAHFDMRVVRVVGAPVAQEDEAQVEGVPV
jgi:hypothetical protein